MKCPKCGYQVWGRNNEQNALAAVWYADIAKQLAEDTPQGVKSHCKLHFGVPILRAEDESFRQKYDRIIKPLSYEDKLSLMEWFPVTSLMSTGQFSRYLKDMQHEYAKRGVVLQSINEEMA